MTAPSKSIGRRGAIIGGVAVAAAGAGALVLTHSARRKRREYAERLTATLENTPVISDLGQACREALPDAPGISAIMGELETAIGSIGNMDDDALRGALAEAVRRDFAGGNTIEVRGWVLADTTVRVAMLAALL